MTHWLATAVWLVLMAMLIFGIGMDVVARFKKIPRAIDARLTKLEQQVDELRGMNGAGR